jgi:hypothetical protein
MWIKTIRQCCPSTCQETNYEFAGEHSNFVGFFYNLFINELGIGPKMKSFINQWVTSATHFLGMRQFAVPAGINPRATKARGTEQVYYVCATHFAGW